MAKTPPEKTPPDMLTAPPAEWAEMYDAMSFDQRREADDAAAALATRATRVSAYISHRLAGGKHADAVKAQNRAARSTRQALGFTYKDDAITF